ncbi:hypothetical protein G6F46_008507 [Rhizopus delemar]|nr:hypothetical protein G6F43_006728 [Rhizopus delemar]KAG1494228.1 hypothetical protein G6F54_008023 [Rhizopus delemar]KAG1508345.1 hypothetical protein G6F53_008265 [Rhizopus delemar]KAG1591565.1 hypothetical protein G6F47_009704 [Rhizopus delemar]KAG1612411.1 hypothetical protein G6F46_008507 [Rhizopus delemar]
MTSTETHSEALDKEINNESSITIRPSSEEKSDDSSLDTVAIQQEVIETKISKRRSRSATITGNNVKIPFKEENPIMEKKGDNELVDGLQQIEEERDKSDSEIEDDRYHARHESHRSTMSSIHSYVSSASNYDLLLARLDNNNNNSNNSSSTALVNSSAEELDEKHNEDIDWEFWSKVISDFAGVSKSEAKVLSCQIQKGIPSALRGTVWQMFAKSKNIKLEEQYMQLLKDESVYEKAIARDLPKLTALNEEHQKEALFNVMKAYSLYDKDVGYSPSLLYVTMPLLLNMPEEETFCVLVQLMNKYGLRGHFLPQPDLLSRRLYQLNGLLADYLPHLHRHFEAHDIKSNMYAYQWFNTLFAYKFPMDIVFRIYDMIFAEGIETLFRFSLALMEKNQSTLLSLEYDDLTLYLKNKLLFIYQKDCDQLVHDAFQIHISPKRLDRLAKDFQIESSKASSEAEIIESLKKQNKQLQESIRQVDHEYTELNQDHTTLAAELITAKMDIVRIHNENEVLRQQTNELKKTLDSLPAEVEARVKEEMEILFTKNSVLVERNSALEEQLKYMETMIIEIKVKYAESEREREGLHQRLSGLKHLMDK